VDDIKLRNEPMVLIKSGLYNASNVLQSARDTLTPIIPGICVDPAITTQPASVVRCSVAGNATFSVVTSGSAPTFQWQLSTNGGGTWSNIGGAVNSTYTIANPTTALNGNLYRVIVSGLCGSPVTSNAAVIYV